MNKYLRNIAKTLPMMLVISMAFATNASAWVSDDVAVSVFGGASNEETLSIKVDSNGNIFSAGFFSGTADFNPGTESESLTALGQDIFISKLDSSGNFLWAKRIGGSGDDVAKSIGVDSAGNVIIAGDFNGTVDFDPGVETATLTSSGQGDVFILKLDPSGNYLWAKSFGGTTADSGIFISVDPQGNSVVTGLFSGTVDFDPSGATFNLSSVGGGWDIYVSKFNSSGIFQWSRSRGGQGTDIGDAVAVDSNGNVYSSGVFSGEVDFNPGTETVTLTSSGPNDMFISKFDSAGNYLWAKRFGGSGSDGSTPISVDGNGNIYLSGDFSGTVDFYPGEPSALITATGTKDNFIVKLDSSGGYLWSKHFGSSGASTTGARTAIDSSGNVFYTGDFTGTIDFDPSAGEANLTSAGGGLSDIFISKLDSSGGYLWAKSVGGTSADRGQAIAVDTSGNVYSTGYFNGVADFYPGAETKSLNSAGGRDVYISELNSSGNVLISSLARVITPTEAALTAARAAAAAEAVAARASAAKQEAEKQSARASVTSAIKDAKELTVESFAKAQIPGINASNIAAVQAELLALPEGSRGDINQVLKVARKYEVVGIIASDQVSRVQPSSLVEIGLIPESSKNKVALAAAIKKLPLEARDSLTEIKAAIEAANVAIQKRSDRLAKILASQAARSGK